MSAPRCTVGDVTVKHNPKAGQFFGAAHEVTVTYRTEGDPLVLLAWLTGAVARDAAAGERLRIAEELRMVAAAGRVSFGALGEAMREEDAADDAECAAGQARAGTAVLAVRAVARLLEEGKL